MLVTLCLRQASAKPVGFREALRLRSQQVTQKKTAVARPEERQPGQATEIMKQDAAPKKEHQKDMDGSDAGLLLQMQMIDLSSSSRGRSLVFPEAVWLWWSVHAGAARLTESAVRVP